MTKYTFTDDMQEISGFGGGYEDACRAMLSAALEWLDDHPNADPQFTGVKNIYGVVMDDNGDAEALSKAAVDAADGDCTGAMHHAVMNAVLWIKANGWEAYVKMMTHSQGHLGILQDKLTRAQEDLNNCRKRLGEKDAECQKRGSIIAEKVLGWKRYKCNNTDQEAYGPDQKAVAEGLYLGCHLSKLVDEAISQMFSVSGNCSWLRGILRHIKN